MQLDQFWRVNNQFSNIVCSKLQSSNLIGSKGESLKTTPNNLFWTNRKKERFEVKKRTVCRRDSLNEKECGQEEQTKQITREKRGRAAQKEPENHKDKAKPNSSNSNVNSVFVSLVRNVLV